MKQIPPIKAVMTPFPHSIDIDAGLDDARTLMTEHRIRHLPVVEEGELCGMLSQRDMDRAEKMGPTRVREVCSRRTYCVDMSTPVTHVLRRMAEAQVGSAMVTRQGKLVGIFTTTDACRAYAETLKTLFPRPDGEDAA
ncbi:hypothetical protein ABI59_21000 [Acidobacteria bacterium Mor1]|nr:hypothetical protein ABI59_21000 [Acidobacteria bacterium Mor1]